MHIPRVVPPPSNSDHQDYDIFVDFEQGIPNNLHLRLLLGGATYSYFHWLWNYVNMSNNMCKHLVLHRVTLSHQIDMSTLVQFPCAPLLFSGPSAPPVWLASHPPRPDLTHAHSVAPSRGKLKIQGRLIPAHSVRTEFVTCSEIWWHERPWKWVNLKERVAPHQILSQAPDRPLSLWSDTPVRLPTCWTEWCVFDLKNVSLEVQSGRNHTTAFNQGCGHIDLPSTTNFLRWGSWRNKSQLDLNIPLYPHEL